MESKNKKSKKKEIVVLALLLLVLCCGVATSVVLFLQKNSGKVNNEGTGTTAEQPEVSNVSSNQYTVMVKSDTGVVLPNVLVAIHDAEGNMITVPEATDAVGRLIYTPEEKGTYGACVMAAPYQYALDREIHYFKAEENLLSIVLKEDPTAQVAQIGDMKYTLKEAIKVANASKEDVTIKLLHDVYVVNELYFNNKSGKTITIDGNGKTVTYLANATAFSITQKAGTVHFKNMKISHNGEGAVFRTSNAINLNLTDITINAKNDTKGFYKWSLINLFGKGKTNLTMTRVKIDMDITTIESGASGAAVIRTGNAGNVKNIKITMNNCQIDATGAKGRAGIRVTEDTTANIVFNNTTFRTQNNYVVAVDGQLNWSEKNSKLGSEDKYYDAHPIPDVVATVGNIKFYSLNAAVKKANERGKKEPVKLVGDISLATSTTFSGDGITAIIDGNGHTITTEGGNTIFKINANNYKLTFKNIKINHGGYERLLQYEANKENINVTWENVKVVASGTSEDACYKYGLMNLRGSGSFTMKSSSITLDVPKIINGSAAAVIRTGNANDGQKLTITLDNSIIDAAATTGAYGIYAQKGTTANIVLKDYEIHTNNTYPVYVHADDGDVKLTFDDMDTWSSKSGSINWLCNLMSLLNMKDAAKIGDTVYATLPEAINAAKEVEGEVTIKLLRDCIISNRTDLKTANSSIIIDGSDEYTLTTKGNALLFVLDNDDVSLTFKDLTIEHNGYDRLVTFNKKSEGVYTGVNLTFDDVTMIASGTSADKCYPYGVFNLRASGVFTMIDSTITVESEKVFGGDGYGVIRLGNANDGHKVNITMENSTIDASKTENIAGINVSNGATAEIRTFNSAIKTKNKHAIHVNSTGKLNFVPVNTAWSYGDAITNCAVKIGNDYYVGLTNAWAVARTSTTPTTITLLKNCTVDSNFETLATANANITIDGDNKQYTLTTTANGANIFTYGANNVSLTFKDIVIKHQGNDRFVTCNKTNTVTYSGINLVLDNVTMTASGTTSDKCYPYGVFNIRANGSVELIDSTITLDVQTTTGGADCGVIRLGNSGDGTNVEITMTNSTIDASKTKKISGIYVNGGVTADIEITDSAFKTNNRYAIDVNATGTLKLKQSNAKWSCTDQSAGINAITNRAARIGDNYYVSLVDAWNVARTSTTPTTITLVNNCTVDSKFETLATANANITIDGDGKQYTLTTTAKGANIFTFGANNVSLTFKDIVIEHQGNDRFVTCNKTNTVTYSGINLVLDNVTMTASGTTSDKCYPYGVFNIRANGSVELIDSTITLDVQTTTGGADCGVIRLGNSGDGTNVTITMTNSTIDASKTKKISGIYVNGGVTADIEIADSTIKTNNRYAIDVNATGIIKLKQSHANWSCTDKSAGINAITNRAARIGDNYYVSFVDAWNVARTSTTPTTITLVNNCTVDSNLATLATANANITIDGDNKQYTLTTTANGANIVTFGANNVSLKFKDIVIKHQGNDRFVTCNKTDTTTYSNIKLVLDNVTMTASGTTSDKCYPYGVFNIRANGSVELKDSTITLDVQTTTGGADCGVIRLGNSGDGTNVAVTMTNSTIDASKTKKIAGIYVNGGVTADIELTDSTIKTNNRYAINVNATGTVTLKESNAKWSCTDQSAGINSITNLAAKVGKDCYKNFEDAWNAALAKNTATTITLLNDVTVTTQLPTISKDGTDITVDGQNKKYTLTAALTVNDKNVIDIGLGGTEKKANLTLQNMKITHKTQRALVGVGKNAKSSAQLNVNNVEITVDYTDTSYYLQYGVFNMRGSATLIMTNVTTTVKSSKTGTDRGIIRVGNNDDGATVYARLQNCTLDTKQATDVAIARVNRGNTLDISCQNCDFETANAYVFNINSTGGTFEASVDKYTEANSVAGGKTQLYNEGVQYEVVENLAQTSAGATINGFLYADAKAAFDDAQLLDGYVTIKMLKDGSWPTPENVSMNTQYVDITIDGQGQYKLTTGTKNKQCSAFYIENDNISLTLKDMDIHHMSQRAIVAVKQRKNADGEAIGSGINISVENVTITTEAFNGTTKHDSGLINIRNNAYLYMKDVKIDYKNSVPTGRNTSYQVIRFGNKSSEDGTKTVTAVLENCEVNVNDGHSTAFFAHTGTTVDLTAKECKFKNLKQNLVYRAKDSNLTLTWDNSTWNDKTGTKSELVYYTECNSGYYCTITGASD